MADMRRESGVGSRESEPDRTPAFDAAIDDVAREMTAAEPPSALRADVLARIERERTGRQSGLFLPRWAWAGVAAVLVLGIATTAWFARTVPAPGAGQIASTSMTAAPATSTPATPAATKASPAVQTMTASEQPTPGPRAALPAAVEQPVGLPDDAGPAALAGPVALDIAPLGPAAIDIPGLGVNTLGEIEPITVSTIGPGSAEPQRRDRE